MALLTGPWKIKRGATSPPYRATLRNADKSPVDLSLADHVNFVMCLRGQDQPTVDKLAATIQVGDADTGTDVGVCEYDWASGDTDSTGIYNVEFALYDATGNVYARIPNDSYLELQILGNLSAGAPGAIEGIGLPVEFDFRIYHGDTWAQAFRLLQAGAPVDLTGATVASSVVDAQDVTTALTVTILNAVDGRLQISAPTGALAVGAYDYDVQVTDTTSAVTTWIKGQLLVDPDVTP
jgi:hypothetical protein